MLCLLTKVHKIDGVDDVVSNLVYTEARQESWVSSGCRWLLEQPV